MERVAFLIEDTGERLGCLLNPESLVMRRNAGVQPLRSAAGLLAGVGLTDDPLIHTGGGRTDLTLDLLFDVGLAGSSITTDDVRDLTGPLWSLAENARRSEEYGHIPLIRLIWGKSWNIPGVIVAVAERLEYFTASGSPQRSWLRLRMLRVNESQARTTSAPRISWPTMAFPEGISIPEGDVRVHPIVGGDMGPLGISAPLATASVLEAPPSIGQAITTADDIVAIALMETPAGQILASAQRVVATAVDHARAEVASWIAAIGQTRAVRAVGAALDTMASTVKSLATRAKTRLVAGITAATGKLSAAWASIRSALRRPGSDNERSIGSRIQATLRPIGPAIEALRAGASLVITAVKTRASQLIRSANRSLHRAADALQPVLARIGAGASTAASRAADAIRSAIDAIRQALDRSRTTGTADSTQGIPLAVNRIAVAQEGLWSAGEVDTAQAVAPLVQNMSFAVKRNAAAGEAISAVSHTRGGETLRATAKTARETLPQPHAAADPETIETLRQSMAEATASAETTAVVVGPEAVEPVSRAATVVQRAVDRWERTDTADMTGVPEALDELAAAADTVEAREEEVTAAAVKAALTTDEPERSTAIAPAPAEPAPAEGETEAPEPMRGAIPSVAPTAADEGTPREAGEGTPEPGTGEAGATAVTANLGERLDQLAHQYYGHPSFWRVLAAFNGIDDPLHLAAGRLLRLPPAAALGRTT